MIPIYIYLVAGLILIVTAIGIMFLFKKTKKINSKVEILEVYSNEKKESKLSPPLKSKKVYKRKV